MAAPAVAAGSAPSPEDVARERARLWGLAYRVTGSAADADDVVQETFARWLERAPGPEATPGWRVRVATNLAIDVLRLRRRRGYVGPWLPAPVPEEADATSEPHAAGEASPETRYAVAESATSAFLVALEALGPRQRAVLILRDVVGYTASETAVVLATTEGNVRVLHARARRALAAYDRDRCVPTAAACGRHRAVLEAFLRALLSQDVAALEALLAASVRTLTDAGGEYTALAAPLVGRGPVARFYLRAALNRVVGVPVIAIRSLNGLPAAVITLGKPVRRQAPCTVVTLELDRDGRIMVIRTVMASRKLVALGGDGARGLRALPFPATPARRR